MADATFTPAGAHQGAERGLAALSSGAGFSALLSAAACCVLPLAFAAVGVGTGGLASLVPFHWPLTIASALCVTAGWAFYVRKRRICARDTGCTSAPFSRATFWMLCLATAFIALSALWPAYIEQPLMKLLLGA